MYVAPATHITAVLYGNDAAIGSIRAHRGTTHGPAYATGAVLALVTWAQREDPHWFGARIPSEPQSVEFVQVAKRRRKTSIADLQARVLLRIVRQLTSQRSALTTC